MVVLPPFLLLRNETFDRVFVLWYDGHAHALALGVVHAWVGQKLLNCFIFKCFTRKTLKKISIGHR
jgi:hypothetical protein